MKDKFWIKIELTTYSIEEYRLYQFAVADFLSNLIAGLYRQNMFLITENPEPFSFFKIFKNDAYNKYSISILDNAKLKVFFDFFIDQKFQLGCLYVLSNLNTENISWYFNKINSFILSDEKLFWVDIDFITFMANDGMWLYLYVDRVYVNRAIHAFRQSPFLYLYKNSKINIECNSVQE
ncbi:MAG: hypothetical protein JNJ94_12780 [Chlorobi bacterium]|nr:hypothetical protein [Chlorobiota bacterium]